MAEARRSETETANIGSEKPPDDSLRTPINQGPIRPPVWANVAAKPIAIAPALALASELMIAQTRGLVALRATPATDSMP
jgi:hypothetical protein